MGKLKSFEANSSRLMGIWGGGHTVDTDPTKKGWRCRRIGMEKRTVWLVGQKGVKGCATLVDIGRGEWDAAIYAEDPALIDLSLRQGRVGPHHGAVYKTVPNVSGFGLKVIELIEEDRESERKYAELLAGNEAARKAARDKGA